MSKTSELLFQFTLSTQFWPSDTLLASRMSGKIYFGPSKLMTNMPQKVVKSKNNTTTCGIQSETKLLLIWLPATTPKDLSLPVFPLEVDLPWSVTLTLLICKYSRTLKSSFMVPRESVTLTGRNGWKLKSNLIQSISVSKVIQSVSSQDALLPSATTNTQELGTLATKRKNNVSQLEKFLKNGATAITKV